MVGSNPSQEVLNLKSDDVIVTGFVTDEELDELYTQMRLVVVPLRTGAGVKGKIIEAVYHKVPVITTSIGIEGINNTEQLISVQDTAPDFADATHQLYNDMDSLNAISKKSQEFIDKYFSENAVKESLSGYIDF